MYYRIFNVANCRLKNLFVNVTAYNKVEKEQLYINCSSKNYIAVFENEIMKALTEELRVDAVLLKSQVLK